MPGLVSAVVLARGDLPALQACLEHLRRGAPRRFDIVVVSAPSAWLAGQRDVRTVRGTLQDGIAAATGDQVLLLDEGVLLPRNWSEGLVLVAGVAAVGPVAHGLRGSQHDSQAAYGDREGLRAHAADRRRRHGTGTVETPHLAALPLLARRADLLDDRPLREHGALRVALGVLAHVEPLPDAGSWPDHVQAPLLSAALIVKDEQTALPRCLASLRGIVDEVVVCDTGSTDRTVAIAEEHGALVVNHPWDDDFAAARNHALAATRGVWVLSIDADEQLHVGDVGALRQALARSSDDALRLPVRSRARREDTEGYVHQAPRFLRRGAVEWVGAVHEVPARAGTGAWVDTPPVPGVLLEHDGYLAEVRAAKGKYDRNLRLAEKDLQRTAPGDPRRWKATYELARTLGVEHAERVEELTAECLALDPPAHFRGGALVLRSGALLRLGRAEEAKAAAREALRVSPEVVTTTLSLATVLELTGRQEEALAVLQSWVPDGTDPAKEQLLTAAVERLTQALSPYQLEGSDPLAALEKWSELPQTTGTRVGRARCLLTLGRVAEAADALAGIDIDELQPPELLVVVAVAGTAGDRDTAGWLLSRAGPLPPDLAEQASALARALGLPVRVEQPVTLA